MMIIFTHCRQKAPLPVTNLTGNTDKLNLDHLKPIRVLVAEDSATIRFHLTSILDDVPGIEVVGQARNGEEALALVGSLRPDVVSMDINMPRMDGLEATRRIMSRYPTPVVIVSGLIERDVEFSFRAIEAGALAVVEKPPDRRNPTFPEKHRLFLRTLVGMARVSLVRRGRRFSSSKTTTQTSIITPPHSTPEVVVVGTSAGGPAALRQFLHELPAEFPVPIVIVQHLPAEFVNGLVKWLDEYSALNVQMAADRRVLTAGVVNLSPGNVHLSLARQDQKLIACFIREKGRYRYQPSVDKLFESAADVCGERAIGVILTGMGSDGANGLLAMYRAGAPTFAQDEESATVFGMPDAAIKRGAVEQVVPLMDLPNAILKLL